MADLFSNLDAPDVGTPTALQLDPGHVAADWQALVDSFWSSAQGAALQAFLDQRRVAGACIYPPRPLRALHSTPLADVRVVILGQDPYHGSGQAEGLAFSVVPGTKIPPSLRNIFKELARDLCQPIPLSGSLQAWTRQGVLLLNTTLTVEDGQPASHSKQGWQVLTDAVIDVCAKKYDPLVFMLWGAHAQSKRDIIAAHNGDQRHLVLCANHPSPLSALRPPEPFIGCGHFSTARAWLAKGGGKDTLKAKSMFQL